MERRGRQRPTCEQGPSTGRRAGETGGKPRKEEFKLRPPVDSWTRIGQRAAKKEERFNNLFCHLSVENLREAFRNLEKSKAAGIDGMTKRGYAVNLEENLQLLMQRLHKGTYRPQPRKRVEIPKTDGRTRPIAISAFEDKLVEWTVARILSLVYEPLFIESSYGFRPRRGAHGAIGLAYRTLKDDERPYVVEIDLKSFFDTVPQKKLMNLMRRRITDRRLRSLIGRFLQAGILQETGEISTSETGTAQGSIISPILANVYLHYCLDEWFLREHASRHAVIVRYADDAIFLFKDREHAGRFSAELKTALERCGLALNEEKSGIVDFRKHQGNVFHFLGFTFYWGKDHNADRCQLKVKTEKRRLYKKIGEFADWIKKVRSRLTLDDIWNLAAAKLTGHYQYYGVSSNRPKLNQFYHIVVNYLFKWLNRRSQRKSFSWERFLRRLRLNPLPTPPAVMLLKPLDYRRVYAH